MSLQFQQSYLQNLQLIVPQGKLLYDSPIVQLTMVSDGDILSAAMFGLLQNQIVKHFL
jgi:hypothetical protein